MLYQKITAFTSNQFNRHVLSIFYKANTVLSSMDIIKLNKRLCAVLSHSVMSDSATPWNVALQASLSMGILQARILEWVAMSSSRGSSQPREETQVSCIAGRFLTV